MKKIFSLFLVILISSCLFAAVQISSDLYDDFFDGKYEYKEPTVSLGPYNAASGIKMNSQNYPSRVTMENTSLNWRGSNFPGNSVPVTDYYDDNIIAIGAVYDIPSAYVISVGDTSTVSSETGWGSQKKEQSQSAKIAILAKVPTIEVSTNSSSDFFFVSQSKPSYRRHFELALQPKMSVSPEPEYHSYPQYNEENPDNGGYIGNVRNFGDNMENIIPLEHPDNGVRNTSNFYSTFWFDLLLALPYDEGSYAEDGIIDNKVKYELAEAEDYASIVTIRISYTPVYEVYELSRKRERFSRVGGLTWYDWSNWDYTLAESGSDEDIVKATVEGFLTLPFSGFFSRLNLPEVESSASFYVYPYPITSSLNLDPATPTNPRRYIDIADINLVYNYDEIWSSESKIESGLQCSITDNNNARIFISARRDPRVSDPYGFMFVHQGASNIIEGVNAVRYTVRVRDNDTGLYTSYDGRDCVDTYYQKILGNGEFLYSKHQFSNPYWHTYDNNSSSQNYNKVRLSHFHTFDGVMSILIDDTSLNMEPGAYESTIYVHLIAP